MSEQRGPWLCLEKSQPYTNPWLSVEHHRVLTPAGTPGIYGVVQMKNIAVGVIPVDSQGMTYLVRQFRYPLNAHSLEIPEGGCPLGEGTLATAVRELKEETGLSAGRLMKFLDLHLSNSVTDERAEVFLALDLCQGDMALEVTEDIQVQKLPLGEAIELAMSGRISDAISVAALLKLKLLLLEHGDNWQSLMAALTLATAVDTAEHSGS